MSHRFPRSFPWPAAFLSAACLLSVTAGAQTLEERHETAKSAFATLSADSPKAHATWKSGVVGPSLVTKARFATQGKTARARAEYFLAQHAELFGVPASQLVFKSESVSGQKTAVHFEHHVDGHRVLRRGMTLTVCPSGHITAISNNVLPVVQLRSARTDVTQARTTALAGYGPNARAAKNQRIETVIVVGPGDAYEAALVHIAPKPGEMNVVEVLVDLDQGKVTSQRSTLAH